MDPKTRRYIKRAQFPRAWAGLNTTALQEVSEIETAVFCHENLFLFTAEKKEDIIKAIDISIKEYEKVREEYKQKRLKTQQDRDQERDPK